MAFLRRSAFQPVRLGSVGAGQMPDGAWSIKHGRDLIAAQESAIERRTQDGRCDQIGAALGRAVTLQVEDLKGEALATSNVGQALMISGAVGFAFGLIWPKPTPVGDNALLFCSVLSQPAELPGGLQALATYLMRGGLIVARNGIDDSFDTIIGPDSTHGERPWEQAMGVPDAVVLAVRNGFEAMWQQVVARAR